MTEQSLSPITQVACVWILIAFPALGSDGKTDPDLVIAGGDPEYGAYLNQECVTCHRNESTHQGIPPIAHLAAIDFVAAMNAYKFKQRENQTMQMIAGRLSDQDIVSLAAYFEQEDQKDRQ